MLITIDGPAGVGKSSVSSYLARELDILLLKSGSFYRALSLALQAYWPVLEELERQLQEQDEPTSPQWQEFWQQLQATQIYQDGEQILLNGQDVTAKLQTPELDASTPALSKLPPARLFINQLLRSQARERSLIAEGRDMGTVVFPQAQHKFFLDASAQVRAQRRWLQLSAQKQVSLSLEQLEQQIRQRDEIDRNKQEGALKAAENASIIDTSNLTFEAVCLIIVGSLKNHYPDC